MEFPLAANGGSEFHQSADRKYPGKQGASKPFQVH
jgi:hypothetical protein